MSKGWLGLSIDAVNSIWNEGVKIVVIGVGGGGGNMINELANSDIAKV